MSKESEYQDSKSLNVFHVTEKYLSERYNIRKNHVKLEPEFSLKGNNIFEPLDDASLYTELRKANISISEGNLKAILKSKFVPVYDPFKAYFESLGKWDESDKDYISELANYVEVEDQKAFNIHFKKWLIRTVRCSIDDSFINRQVFVLIHPRQNSGKSTFCRFLVPTALQEYKGEDLPIDKDGLIMLVRNILINLDELASLQKSEVSALKSYISKDWISARLPYDRRQSNIARRCSFIGSTNQINFLTDETGSSRWLCFKIKKINWDYKTNINIDNVWRQAYSLYQCKNFDHNFTREEQEENEIRNAEFQIPTIEGELISRHFTHPDKEGNLPTEFLQATEIMDYLNRFCGANLKSVEQIGKGMIRNGFRQVKKGKSPTEQRYGYEVKKIGLSF